MRSGDGAPVVRDRHRHRRRRPAAAARARHPHAAAYRPRGDGERPARAPSRSRAAARGHRRPCRSATRRWRSRARRSCASATGSTASAPTGWTPARSAWRRSATCRPASTGSAWRPRPDGGPDRERRGVRPRRAAALLPHVAVLPARARARWRWSLWGYRLSGIAPVPRQFAVVLDERARLSREIHDTLLQDLGRHPAAARGPVVAGVAVGPRRR